MTTKKSDPILCKLNSIEKRLSHIEQAVVVEEQEEDVLAKEEEAEVAELEKLEKLEKQIEKEVKDKPISKITYRDFSKSAVGAFFGVLGHFSFFYGLEIGETISMTRASVLYVVAFLVGALFLYFTGFRRVRKDALFHVVPIRLGVIYVTSLLVIVIILMLFDHAFLHEGFEHIYKTVAAISVLAVMGAATADLIGKENE